MSGSLDRAWGRIASAIGFGVITATKALGGRGVREAQVRFSEEEIRDGTPLMALWGFASRPKEGADGVLVFVGGNRSKGIVIATNDRRFQLELAEGEVAMHDDLGQKVHLTRAGIVADAPLGLTVNGNVAVNGSLTATGDVTAGAISLQHHRHGNVQPGTGQTGQPSA